MKVGDTVEVYEDPITCEKLEGVAILIKKVYDCDANGLESWGVRFKGEQEIMERKILLKV